MSFSIEKLPGTAFLSFPQMKELLESELKSRLNCNLSNVKAYGDLLYLDDYELKSLTSEFVPYWARTVFCEPFLLHFDSIGDAATALKQIQRLWAPYQFQLFRRASLLQEKLPYINLKEKTFPYEIKSTPLGCYTLLDEHTILASAKTSSPLPCGTLNFEEDHENPPSRAYLKIQESLCLAHYFFDVPFPSENQRCFEAGACPGGWTWVLANLGANVFAVDRSELVPSLMNHPRVKFMAHDAFTLKCEDLGEFDWIFSDVICYPERLLEWVKMWIESGKCRRFICTIKMQGEINWEIVKQFEEIPSSKVVHLNYNKHELTFIHVE